MIDLTKASTINIGRRGENHFRIIEFDVSSLVGNAYPSISLQAIYKRPDGNTYPVVTTYDNGVLKWSPSATDTIGAGVGELEIRVVFDDVVGKSVKVLTIIDEALVDGITPPPEPPAQEWLNQVLSTLNALNINDIYSLLNLTYSLLDTTHDIIENNYTLLNTTNGKVNDTYGLLSTTNNLITDNSNILNVINDLVEDNFILLNTVHGILEDNYDLLTTTNGSVNNTYNLLNTTNNRVNDIHSLATSIQNSLTTTSNVINAINTLLEGDHFLLTSTSEKLNDTYNLLTTTNNQVTDSYNLISSIHDLIEEIRDTLYKRTDILLNHIHPIETATAPDLISRRAAITFTNIVAGNNLVLGSITYVFVASIGTPSANNVQVRIQGTLRQTVWKLTEAIRGIQDNLNIAYGAGASSNTVATAYWTNKRFSIGDVSIAAGENLFILEKSENVITNIPLTSTATTTITQFTRSSYLRYVLSGNTPNGSNSVRGPLHTVLPIGSVVIGGQDGELHQTAYDCHLITLCRQSDTSEKELDLYISNDEATFKRISRSTPIGADSTNASLHIHIEARQARVPAGYGLYICMGSDGTSSTAYCDLKFTYHLYPVELA